MLDEAQDSVSVTIVNDMVLEFTHSFELILEDADTSGLPGFAGSPASITFTIIDDEGSS